MEKEIRKETWTYFSNSGMLWFVNRILHVFGWSIVFERDIGGDLLDVYPARVKHRGFSEHIEERGFKNISNYLYNNADQLLDEVFESDE